MHYVAMAALLVLLGAGAAGGADPERELARATLLPLTTDPLKLRCSGFKRRERVRVTARRPAGPA